MPNGPRYGLLFFSGDNMTTGIDFETFLIGNESVFPKPVCLSWYDGTETGLLNRAESESYLHEILTKKELIVAHNAVFECGVTITHFPDLKNMVFDALDNNLIYCTYINEALWNVQREKKVYKLALDGLVKHYFDTDISAAKNDPDAWRLRYSELDDIPIDKWPEAAKQYAIDDSIWAYRLKEKQEPINQSLALKSGVYLNLMGAAGFRIEQSRVELLEHELREYLKPRYEFLAQHGFCLFVGNKVKKKTKLMREHIVNSGVELQYTEKGGIATSQDALDFYMSQIDDPIIKTYSELSKYEKILSAYVSHMKGAPKIYTSYGTTLNTGRTSSSGSDLYDSVNIQNQPREVKGTTYDVRNCYKARPGFKVVSIDYSGLELCSSSHQLYTTLGYSKMRDMLNGGSVPVDAHSHLAARRKGISYEEFMLRKAELKADRNKAKPLNLSFPGGVGYDTMRYLMYKADVKTHFQILEKAKRKSDLYYYLTNLGVPDLRIKRLNKKEYALVQDELVGMKRDLFSAYPELEEFLKETHKKFMTGKIRKKKNEFGEWEEDEMYMYDIYGFKRDWCTYTALCNGFLMQTPAAVGAQRAMCRIIREFYDNPDVFPQAFIHDEVIVELRQGTEVKYIPRISEILIDEMHTVLNTVRISVEAEVCGQFWRKSGGEWSKTYWKNEPQGILYENS